MELNREQRIAAETLDGPVLVSAGAGSGKTRTLTERIVNAVVPGRAPGWDPIDIRGVVAITYTNKAADEISDRVRRALRAAGETERPGRQDQRLSEGWISTVHSMCVRLLRRYAFEADVDPLFAVGDTVTLGELRRQAFEEVAIQAVERGGATAQLFDEYPFAKVRSAVETIVCECETRGVPVDSVDVEKGERPETLWIEMVERLKCDIEGCAGHTKSSKTLDEFRQRGPVLLAELERVKGTSVSDAEKLEAISEVLGRYKPLTSLHRSLPDLVAAQKEFSASMAGRVLAARSEHTLRALVELASAYQERYRAMKQAMGVLDFQDLQVKAVDLLERDERVRRALRESIGLVMVDEFQDTDMLQMRLVSAISDGNLCTVGDEKQSIYAFRGADLDVYRAHRAQMQRDGARSVELKVNYRSHPGILAFVNHVFGSEEYFSGELLELMPPEGTPDTRELDLVVGHGPRVEMQLTLNEGAKGQRVRMQAARVAARVKELLDAGAKAADIAILLVRYTNAHVFADELASLSIPATIAGGDRFNDTDEVITLRALVSVIANPLADESLLTLVTGDFAPISDDGLVALKGPMERRDRALWETLGEGDAVLSGSDASVARRFVDVVERARERLGRVALSEIILLAVEEMGYDVRLLARGFRGQEAMANVIEFSRLAAEFEQRHAGGAGEFGRYLDRADAHGERRSPKSLPDGSGQSVRIASIHSSKGLEYPIVFADLSCQDGPGGAGEMVWVDGDMTRVSVAIRTKSGESSTPRAAAIEAKRRSAADDEAKRLAYVAFTRARDLLVLTGDAKVTKAGLDGVHANRLLRIAGIDASCVPPEGTVVTVGGCDVAVEVAWCPEDEEDTGEAAAAGGVVPFVELPAAGADIEETRLPDRMSYTHLQQLAQCPRRFRFERVLGVRDYEAVDPEAPRSFGSAMHAALQLSTRERPVPERARIEAIARFYALGEEGVARLADAVAAVTASAPYERAVGADMVAREVPFGFRVDDTFELRGAIDLMGRSGRDAWIVDYKSGTSSAGEEHYELQARCYALAALRAGSEHVDVSFVCPERPDERGEPRVISFAYTAGDRGAMERGLGEIRERAIACDFGPSPGEGCGSCPVLREWCEHAHR